jgi:hypothetical protein
MFFGSIVHVPNERGVYSVENRLYCIARTQCDEDYRRSMDTYRYVRAMVNVQNGTKIEPKARQHAVRLRRPSGT